MNDINKESLTCQKGELGTSINVHSNIDATMEKAKELSEKIMQYKVKIHRMDCGGYDASGCQCGEAWYLRKTCCSEFDTYEEADNAGKQEIANHQGKYQIIESE